MALDCFELVPKTHLDRSMRVMLTGASGFVGRAALQGLLRCGVEVHTISRHPPAAESGLTVSWLRCDILDAAALRAAVRAIRPDVVLHIAWYVEHGAFWTSPLNLDWAAASMNLAKLAAEQGARRFVGIGTCFEYDWPANGDCDEAMTPVRPSTLYGVAKDAVRRVVEAYSAEVGMSFAWARLFFLYGSGEDERRLVPSVARALVRGEPACCSRGLALRDFMDVHDAGAALAALTLSNSAGAFNIASGQAATVAEVANTLGKLAGRPDLVKLGALTDRPGEPPRITAKVDRLRSVYGAPIPVGLALGLENALRFWAERGAGGAPMTNRHSQFGD